MLRGGIEIRVIRLDDVMGLLTGQYLLDFCRIGYAVALFVAAERIDNHEDSRHGPSPF
jgi:hypothetical protein